MGNAARRRGKLSKVETDESSRSELVDSRQGQGGGGVEEEEVKISKRERARQPGRGKDRGHHRLTRVRPLCLCHVHWGRHAMAGPERMATGNIARMVYFGAYRDSRVNLPRPAVVAAPSFGPSRLRCWSRKAATPHWLREGAKCCCLDFRPPCAPPHPCCRPISRTSDLRVPGLVGFHVTLSDRQPEAYPMPVPASCQL